MYTILSQTLAITAPVFSMLFIGVLLKRIGAIDTTFINTASKLVFNGTMPTLLFLGIVEVDIDAGLQPGVLIYFAIASVLGFFLSWAWAIWRCPYADRGVFAQGSFRGNNGIIGLALATSMYGSYGLSLGSILAGAVIIFYNSLSAIVLAVYSPTAKADPWSLLKSIVSNPLIIGVVAAIPFAAFQIPIPAWMLTSGHYFAQLTLPLALICIGGTLSLASLRKSSGVALEASLVKMVWMPIIFTFIAWLLGFRGADLGVLFLYFGAPTAAASYVMTRAYNGNDELAAAIIVVTTLMAVLTTNIGIIVLQWGEWI
ncbi:AEC family transporter [Pseudomonas matsuisoli]|uniref:Malate transporter n=1 Tax=Pseudomonas matsuisoli TaxID=1515666 RepID=A0A917V0R1_9PSED|nr:AEC family transporter [Pseudomonas matsuisoli]GGK08209.1 malate transporter [Pseudomonas matsuisoli]